MGPDFGAPVKRLRFSIPCDDLAFAGVDVCRVEQVAGATAHQEFRAAAADRVVAAAAGRGFASPLFRQLRKREDLAPGLPGGRDLVGVGADEQRNRKRGVAMHQHQRLRVVEAAQTDAEKVPDADVHGHPHAVDGAAQYDAFAVKFDVPHAVVCAGVMRIEAERKGKRVEPQCAARPGGVLTALSPRRDYVPGRYVRP